MQRIACAKTEFILSTKCAAALVTNYMVM